MSAINIRRIVNGQEMIFPLTDMEVRDIIEAHRNEVITNIVESRVLKGTPTCIINEMVDNMIDCMDYEDDLPDNIIENAFSRIVDDYIDYIDEDKYWL